MKVVTKALRFLKKPSAWPHIPQIKRSLPYSPYHHIETVLLLENRKQQGQLFALSFSLSSVCRPTPTNIFSCSEPCQVLTFLRHCYDSHHYFSVALVAPSDSQLPKVLSFSIFFVLVSSSFFKISVLSI
jgi:hypothetical protein